MKALRVQVERVVRPIWASNLRKDRMREELLAHLTRLFDEELARSGDIETATDEAIRRFGDARALSRELQEGVPWLERWAFFRFPPIGPARRRRGESPLGFLMRTNGWALAVSLIVYSMIALHLAIIVSRRPHRPDQLTGGQVVIVVLGTALIQFAAIAGWGLVVEGIRQELERHAAATSAVERRKAIWRIVGYVAASSALLGGAPAGLVLLVQAFTPISFITRTGFCWIAVGAVALGPLFTLKGAVDWKASTRRFENWESLDLDERPAA
jgi:hypothetical protein